MAADPRERKHLSSWQLDRLTINNLAWITCLSLNWSLCVGEWRTLHWSSTGTHHLEFEWLESEGWVGSPEEIYGVNNRINKLQMSSTQANQIKNFLYWWPKQSILRNNFHNISHTFEEYVIMLLEGKRWFAPPFYQQILFKITNEFPVQYKH